METEDQGGNTTTDATHNPSDEPMDFDDFISNEDPFGEVQSSVPKTDLGMEIDLLDEIEKIVGDAEKTQDKPEKVSLELEESFTSNKEFEKADTDDLIGEIDEFCNTEKDVEKISNQQEEEKIDKIIEEDVNKGTEVGENIKNIQEEVMEVEGIIEDAEGRIEDTNFIKEVEIASIITAANNDEPTAEEKEDSPNIAGEENKKDDLDDLLLNIDKEKSKPSSSLDSSVKDQDEILVTEDNKNSSSQETINLCSDTQEENVDTNVPEEENIDTHILEEENLETNILEEENMETNVPEEENVDTNVPEEENVDTNVSECDKQNSPTLGGDDKNEKTDDENRDLTLQKEYEGFINSTVEVDDDEEFVEKIIGIDEDDEDEEFNKTSGERNEDSTSMDAETNSKDQGIQFEEESGIATVTMDDFQNYPMQDDEASDPFGNKEDPKQPNTAKPTFTDNDSNSNTQTGFLDEGKTDDNSTMVDESHADSRSGSSDGSTKYMITHCHENNDKSCGICDEKLAPRFMAKKKTEIIYICESNCLNKFKDDHPDDYEEKILRLRAFAVEEKDAGKKTSDREYLVETKDNYEKDSSRKCRTCSKFINLNQYITWEAADFCKEACILSFQRSLSVNCTKCEAIVVESLLGKFCVRFGNIITQFCSTSCLLAYKKAGKFCAYCQEDIKNNTGEFNNFCSKRCSDVCSSDQIPLEKGECAVCHFDKPVEIKYQGEDKTDLVCSFPCFVAYKFVNNIDPVKCQSCTVRFDIKRNKFSIYKGVEVVPLCSQNCQKIYLIKNRQIVVCVNCSVKKYDFDMITIWTNKENNSFTCSNACLQKRLDLAYEEECKFEAEINLKQIELFAKEGDYTYEGKRLSDIFKATNTDTKLAVHKVNLTNPKPFVRQRNIATMCKPNTITKSIMCKPRERTFATQTDKVKNTLFVPIPIPYHVMVPLHMYVEKVPMLVPIPIPLPVPIFVPTNRKSIKGIRKEIEKITNKIPTDPLEAELLMMADMAAGDKKDDTSSESEAENLPEPSTSTSYGEDVLSMALKMANDFDDASNPRPETSKSFVGDPASRIESIMEEKRKNIRQQVRSRTKRTDSNTSSQDSKNDSNLTLKYTFGVNAWKQWVTTKNNELQKSRRAKFFKAEMLQLNTEDLNYALSLFVKEVRKPNGSEYAPDTIYYLCLGIQQYLYENGRVDHLFCDPLYEKFTDSFNEVCLKFASIYDNSQYIVTRVEEEHLWESKQLGAHSPLVLLNTLMFFNTKHFSLTTVQEHLQLSFSHIMKHWKRNPNAPGCRNVLLRFYPPQSKQTGRKRRLYEQQENEDNPLRCPVKLYEFYLSKCPESVKTRNDVFYLQPERSCVPDSPVWYSTMAMNTEPLEKMLNRVKMIKEINISLLTITQ